MPPAVEQTISPQASSTPGPRRDNAPRQSPVDVAASPVVTNGNRAEGSVHKGHQRIVLADSVAFLYLEEDPSTTVLLRRTTLQEYEIYIVEQWACSRVHPTFIMTTYTGDPSHKISVGVLSVPTDRNSWSPRLKLYFNAVQQYHATSRETPLGTLMVTNLSAFPSALTLISVPDGELKKHKEHFIVNENLKRLGCAGRAGLKLQTPSPVVEAKFHQLYRTSERVPLYAAVMELVKQCQTALTIFDKLAPEFVDGLLCDVTEKAISDWWADMGTDFYNIEPSDGVLGPTTVAALLGTLMGARNRLHAFGAPVPKDAFDISGLKRGIASFQKSQKMERTRRLDRRTLDRLHRATAKVASSERWTGAVKSTVAELSGKGGEMVMGMVGRDKSVISDIETLDLERFAQLATGERGRWLWQGKPRKTGFDHESESTLQGGGLLFTKDDQGGYVWTSRKRHTNLDVPATRVMQDTDRSRRAYDSPQLVDDRDQNLGRMVSRSLTEKVSDARAGFGRFKDAVGLPGLRSHHNHHNHQHKLSKESINLESDVTYNTGGDSEADAPDTKSPKQPSTAVEERAQEAKTDSPHPSAGEHTTASPTIQSQKSSSIPPEIHIQPESPSLDDKDAARSRYGSQDLTAELVPTGSASDDLELSRTHTIDAPYEQGPPEGLAFKSLRRSQSFPGPIVNMRATQRDARWPRHLSFSTVEEVMLVWEGFRALKPGSDQSGITESFENAILHEDVLFSDAQILSSRVLELSQMTVPWVEEQVTSVERLHQTANSLQEELGYVYPECSEEFQLFRDRVHQVLGEESSLLTEGLKKIELLGAKLDYELNVLKSKVEDVEEGLQDFERNVDDIETRIKDLVQGEQRNDISWLSWIGRNFGHA